MPAPRILRIRDVLARTGVSRSSLYRFIDDGSFPRPVALGAKATGWVEAEISQWIESRIAERDTEA